MDSVLDLVINGQSRSFPELTAGATLNQLLTALGLQHDRVAVERNGQIISRPSWPTTSLAQGDKLEIVHFVGGGTGAIPPFNPR
jgi:thiamine biosynthesis protein ThiS